MIPLINGFLNIVRSSSLIGSVLKRLRTLLLINGLLQPRGRGILGLLRDLF